VEKTYKSDGCEFDDITADHAICKCTHLTDFATSFLQTGLDTFANSNIFLILRYDLMAKVDPFSNLGVYFTIVSFFFFAFFFILMRGCDETSFKTASQKYL
jgi:hypothetical protein